MKYRCPICRASGIILLGQRYVCKNKATMMKCAGELAKKEAEAKRRMPGVPFAASVHATPAAALQPMQEEFEEFEATEIGPVIRSPVAPAEEQRRLPNDMMQHVADRLLEGIERQFVWAALGILTRPMLMRMLSEPR